MHSCTLRLGLALAGTSESVLRDCIIPTLECHKPGVRVEFCNVHGKIPFVDQAKPGQGCISAPPLFRDPANLDFRLMPGSPGTGMASDGGDIGVRYTPEMIEMATLAFELRAKGLIKF